MTTDMVLKKIDGALFLVINRCGCRGTKALCQTCTERVPKEILAAVLLALPVVVLSEQRRFTWIESLLGAGSLVTCVDDGRHQERPIDELIEELRAGRVIPGPVQACDIAHATEHPGIFKLCSYLALVSTASGYKVVAEWGDAPHMALTFAPRGTVLPVGFMP